MTLPLTETVQPGAGPPSRPEFHPITWITMKDQPHTNTLKAKKIQAFVGYICQASHLIKCEINEIQIRILES